MDDKVFELLEKMYADLSGKLDEVNKKLDQKADKNDIVRLENELKPKVELALEGYQQVYEKLQEHDTRFDSLDSKVQKQDVEIRVIKGGLNP